MKALLKFTVVYDHDFGSDGKIRPMAFDVKLYNDPMEGAMVWRCHGPMGDEFEGIGRPASIRQAKDDVLFIALYSKGYDLHATWLDDIR